MTQSKEKTTPEDIMNTLDIIQHYVYEYPQAFMNNHLFHKACVQLMEDAEEFIQEEN